MDPRLFSPAALNLAARLPKTDNPCGETKFGLPQQRDQWQGVTRLDYQLSANNSVFGRYIATKHDELSGISLSGGNPLASLRPNIDNLAQTMTVGHTVVLGNNTVNAVRAAFNRTAVNRFNDDHFTPSDLGAKLYNNSPTRETQLTVTGGFQIGQGQSTKSTGDNNAFQVSNELTMARGRHQLGFGANVAYWTVEMWAYSRGNGQFSFSGQNTGLGLSDCLLRQTSAFVLGKKVCVAFHHRYQGF